MADAFKASVTSLGELKTPTAVGPLIAAESRALECSFVFWLQASLENILKFSAREIPNSALTDLSELSLPQYIATGTILNPGERVEYFEATAIIEMAKKELKRRR